MTNCYKLLKETNIVVGHNTLGHKVSKTKKPITKQSLLEQ